MIVEPEPIKKILISQSDNYNGNFGEVLRSSAVFWVKNSEKIQSTISLSNYWKYKNFLDVSIIINLRHLNGNLVSRKIIKFENSEVFNYTPPNHFEGSVEVEVFSLRNMRIPYAAVMAVYETANSISMVHSYSRVYSQHEIEDRHIIPLGKESCWTIRETDDVTSFCVIHNGPALQPKQLIKLGIRNSENKEQSISFQIPSLAPFECLIIEPKKYFPNIVKWLDGKPGNGRLSFKVNAGFTRMLCGVKKIDDTQLQVTHSNFDYSEHDTDKIKEGILKAYMYTPNLKPGYMQEIVVYPDTNMGEYIMNYHGYEDRFSTGSIVRKPFDTNEGLFIEFARTDNILPTRIVTALRINSHKDSIPAECSLGVIHHHRPKKHFFWMLVSEKFESFIYWTDYAEIYGGCPPNAELVFKLYTPKAKEPLTTKFNYSELPANNFIYLCDIFNKTAILEEEFGYLTVWCSYGGLMFFSSLKKHHSISIEHCF